MYNPQYPHTLRVLRSGLDLNGEPIVDDEGNPVEQVVSLKKVVMNGHQPTFDANGKFVTEDVDSIRFGYRQSSMNTRAAGKVIVSDYKISCQMFITPLNPGDIIEITDYEKTFRGVVVKKDTFNFGTLLWFDRIKNESYE